MVGAERNESKTKRDLVFCNTLATSNIDFQLKHQIILSFPVSFVTNRPLVEKY